MVSCATGRTYSVTWTGLEHIGETEQWKTGTVIDKRVKNKLGGGYMSRDSLLRRELSQSTY